jgi:hypothetical protein
MKEETEDDSKYWSSSLRSDDIDDLREASCQVSSQVNQVNNFQIYCLCAFIESFAIYKSSCIQVRLSCQVMKNEEAEETKYSATIILPMVSSEETAPFAR